ncbi:MAG: hypothetical protein N3D16_04770 [Anaerolineales bacterium]|nr:hypothetical protein [Anaerolineales bacterium]
MPKAIVSLNYQLCDPNQCDQGVCRAVALCRRKVLHQEKPFEPPQLNSELCLGCAVCTTACSVHALMVLPW